MQELRPCPFCGENLVRNEPLSRAMEPLEVGLFEHPNNNCLLRGLEYTPVNSDYSHWNTRPPEPKDGLQADPAVLDRLADQVADLQAKLQEARRVVEKILLGLLFIKGTHTYWDIPTCDKQIDSPIHLAEQWLKENQ